METALQGSLQSFKPPGILTLLSMSEKTGCLHLQNGKAEAFIYLDRGSVVFATSNEERFRLAGVLMKKQKISEVQWKRLEEIMTRQGEKFGKVAVAEGILTEKELRNYLKIQVSEILYNCLSWNDGRFVFDEGLTLPGFAVTISIDLTNLLMEGARRIDEWVHFSKLLPDNQIVFRLAGNFESQKRINLSLDEWKILFLINGKRTLEQICSESTEEPLEVYRVVYGLYVNQFLEPSDDLPRRTTAPIQEASTQSYTVDDTRLLVSPEAQLSYQDVLKVTLARLVLQEQQEQETRTFPLVGDQYMIGRQPGADIHIADPNISSVHARIFKGPEGYFLEDLNSRNGTFINGTRIDRRLLHDKDSIQVGKTNLVYNIVYEIKPLSGLKD